MLGFCYANGFGVKKSTTKAINLFKIIAKRDVVNAKCIVELIGDYRQNICLYDKELFQWIKQSANRGDRNSEYDLGWMYYNCYGGVSQDYNKAFKSFSYAAFENQADAQYSLSLCYYYDKGLNVSVQWLKKAIAYESKDARLLWNSDQFKEFR